MEHRVVGADASVTPAQRFAEVKRECAALLQMGSVERSGALEALQRRDPALALEVASLLHHVDEADLEPTLREDVLVGTRIGAFHILHRIGSGGMGEVYLAERFQAGFEQRVALKVVHRAAVSDELNRRFVRERQLLARLQHVGIARLIDGGFSDDGRPWLAMEYVAGQSLMLHASTHQLGVDARVELIRPVIAAVAYAHRNLVVHRDLKPGNILVNTDGEPKLLDFGIAKLLDDSALELTRAGQHPMTLRYAAPEQLAGERTTTAADIYALGVILFELITETAPHRFAESDTGEPCRRLPGAPLARLGLIWRGHNDKSGRALSRRVTGDLDRIVQKATAGNPLERYASVSSLDGDLEDWLAERPLRSGIGSAAAQSRFLLRRYRWPIVTAVTVAVALGGGALLAWQQARIARQQAAIAGAHLEALLDVLGSANPHKYAGRDPTASEFLLSAAQRMQSAYRADPVLSRRALTEIGHGLINLGRPQEAEQVLTEALLAADRDPHVDAEIKLSILGLLVQVQDTAATRQHLPATVQRIEALAREPGTAPAAVADALARAGATLSRSANYVAANRALHRAGALIDAHPEIDSGIVENYLRQRGWVALRALDIPVAEAALQRAAEICEANPGQFSKLRCAEGEMLIAETALAAQNALAARQHIARARGAFFAEYAVAHPERAAFELHEAHAHLLLSEFRQAGAILQRLLPIFHAQGSTYAREYAIATAMSASAAAGERKCTQAHAAMTHALNGFAELGTPLPRDLALLRRAEYDVELVCAAGTAPSVEAAAR